MSRTIYMCNECGNEFDYSGIRERRKCPINGCMGETFYVDEEFSEACKMLNKKGYTVKHYSYRLWGDSAIYLDFYGNYSFPSLPDGFEVEYDRWNYYPITIIRKEVDRDLSDRNRIEQEKETARDVLAWAKSLKCLKQG